MDKSMAVIRPGAPHDLEFATLGRVHSRGQPRQGCRLGLCQTVQTNRQGSFLQARGRLYPVLSVDGCPCGLSAMQ